MYSKADKDRRTDSTKSTCASGVHVVPSFADVSCHVMSDIT